MIAFPQQVFYRLQGVQQFINLHTGGHIGDIYLLVFISHSPAHLANQGRRAGFERVHAFLVVAGYHHLTARQFDLRRPVDTVN